MTIFLVSLAGIPPLGGWVAKFFVFRALVAAGSGWAVSLAVIGVVNSVIALFYYLNVARQMWFEPTPDGDTSPVRVPPPLVSALAICAVATVAIGVVPGIVLHFGDLADFATVAR